ncbi:MAG: hypothetical protein AAFY56_09690, partial [Pseudomonadota bacterium]
ALESELARVWDGCDPSGHGFYEAAQDVNDDTLSIWLGKIFWLLGRLGYESLDPTTRDQEAADTVMPQELMPYMTWLGLYMSAYAHGKNAWSCYHGDLPARSFYGPSYSLYRFRIDDQGQPLERFDFNDHYMANGVSMRLGDLGLICLYDDGLHKRWRGHRFEAFTQSWAHSLQFTEIVGRMYYDQLMRHPRALLYTTYWNDRFDAVITCNHWTRHEDPYWGIGDNPELYLETMNRLAPGGTHSEFIKVGDKFTTFLWDDAGRIWDCVKERPRQANQEHKNSRPR